MLVAVNTEVGTVTSQEVDSSSVCEESGPNAWLDPPRALPNCWTPPIVGFLVHAGYNHWYPMDTSTGKALGNVRVEAVGMEDHYRCRKLEG